MKNNRSIIIVIILSFLVVGLGGYLLYDKIINKDNIKMPDDSYLGIWLRKEYDFSDDLNIIEISKDTIKFELGILRIINIEATGRIEGNIIKFTANDIDISGTLVFYNNTITVSILECNWEHDIRQEIVFTYKSN